MKAIEHKLKHYFQPTNNSCGQASLAMLLSHYGNEVTPESLIKDIPVLKRPDGSDWGNITTHFATWCVEKYGLGADFYTFDFQIVDLSWSKLKNDEVVKNLEKVKKSRNIPNLGKEASELYIESYVEMIKAGVTLHIGPYPTTSLLYKLIQNGPIVVVINYNVFYNSGRSISGELRESVLDDNEGILTNHSVVITGINEKGEFHIADPWRKEQFVWAEPERLLAGITAALVECDSYLFTLKK